MKLFGKKLKGFSLIELVVVMSIIIFLVGVAAAYFSDYLYRAKVAKAYEDLDVFSAAIQLYDAESQEPLTYANYNNAGVATTSVSLMRHFPNNQVFVARGDTTELSTTWTARTDTLNNLLGKYLTTIPADPWGGAYSINTHCGAVFSLGEDGVKDAAGTNGPTTLNRNKDLVQFYLSSNFAMTKAVILDRTSNKVVDAGDTLELSFSSTVNWMSNLRAAGIGSFRTQSGANNLWNIFVQSNSQPNLAVAASLAGPTYPLNGRIARVVNEPRMIHVGLVAQDITYNFAAGKWVGENPLHFAGSETNFTRKVFTPNPWYTGQFAATATQNWIGRTTLTAAGIEIWVDAVGKGLTVNGVQCTGFKIY